MSSGKRRPFCLGHNELTHSDLNKMAGISDIFKQISLWELKFASDDPIECTNITPHMSHRLIPRYNEMWYIIYCPDQCYICACWYLASSPKHDADNFVKPQAPLTIKKKKK